MWRKQEHDRSWALPRLKISDIFLILEIEETFLTIKCIGGQKKGGVKLHIDLFTCLRDRHAHTGVPPDKPYTDSEPGKARWLAKGNPEEMPHERDLNYQEVVNTGCFLIYLLYSELIRYDYVILWPPDANSQLTGKDPDVGKDWRQKEKGTTEHEMVGWHHRLDGRQFEQALGDSKGQGSLACCSPWGHKESDMTYRLNNSSNIQN